MSMTPFTKESPILLVDDSMAMRQTVKNVLASHGHMNIHAASNGKEALTKIRESTKSGAEYRVIFLDWNMPEMDGLEFLRICRNDMGLKNIAIIMLTAVSDQKSVVTALNNGATSYITKPVSAETIMKKIGQVSGWLDAQDRKA